jgi:flagellar basal-body rod protein FlgG
MMRALGIAASGMEAQQTNVEVISNNIANVSTTGFKRSMAQFEDLLYQSDARVGSASSESGTLLPTGTQLGLGVRNSGTTRVVTQGSLTQTSNTLDLAINGRGYFGVTLPNSEVVYTRDGSFQLSPTGQIVTNEGYPVVPGISVSPTATAVSSRRSANCSFSTSSTRPGWKRRAAIILPRPTHPAIRRRACPPIRDSAASVRATSNRPTST